MIVFYRYLHGLWAPIMREVFTKRILKCNPRSCRAIILSNPKTKKFCTDTIAYKAARLWSTPPTRYENLPSLDLLKFKVKNWHCSDSPYSICRIFVDIIN